LPDNKPSITAKRSALRMGLENISVHTGSHTSILVALQSMGSHGHDGYVLSDAFFFLADGGGGFESIHPWHLNVHEHQMEILFFKDFDCCSAICGHHDGITALFQQTDREYLICRKLF
jgi:hypothetical protein